MESYESEFKPQLSHLALLPSGKLLDCWSLGFPTCDVRTIPTCVKVWGSVCEAHS